MSSPRDRHRDRTHQERSGEHCPGCGRPFDTVDRVDVHHRDGNEDNGAPENLRKRCRRCHLEGEHDRPDDTGRNGPRGVRRSGPQGVRSSGPR